MWTCVYTSVAFISILGHTLVPVKALQCSSNIRCVCLGIGVNSIEADCSYKGLSTIPRFYEDVVLINLSGNYITTLPTNYSFPENLKILNLSNNTLENLGSQPFAKLYNLTSLDLSENRLNLNDFYKGIFGDLKMLKQLNLKRNKDTANITEYPGQALSEATNLKELRLDGIKNAKLGSDFQSLHKLSVLDFSGTEETTNCNIYGLFASFFNNTPYVETLDLSWCNLQTIEIGSIGMLPRLKHLNLSQNNFLTFRVLSNLTFDLQFTSIKTLRINYIHCSSGIGTIIFKDDIRYLANTSIEEIYLSRNRLELIESGVASHIPKSLTILDLSSNNLEMGMYVFEFFNIKSDIRTFNLNDQMIHYGHTRTAPILNCHDWRGPREKDGHQKYSAANVRHDKNTTYRTELIINLPPTLTNVDLSETHINVDITACTFSNDNRLKVLNLRKTSVHHWMGPVKNLHHLKRLDLSNNECRIVSLSFFNDFPALDHLTISDNYLGDILSSDDEGNLFKRLNKLTVLDISNNAMGVIPPKLFQGLGNLKTLYARSNTLMQFNVEIAHMRNITLIDLSTNRIDFFNSVTMDEITTISKTSPIKIDLSKNSLLCACDTLDFLVWMSNRRSMFRGINEYTCRHNKQQILFSKLDAIIQDLENNCRDYIGLIAGIIITIVVSFMSVIVGILYRYRWKMRYIYYITKNKFRTESQGRKEHQYKYDAFFSYANEDRDFIVNDVIENIETRHGINLCLHSREFIGGRPIAENITRAVHESRKTIVILTKNYLLSFWCIFEFQMARMESAHSRDGDKVLFIVMLEHVDHKDIPLMMMDIIDSDTYIEYPTDEQGKLVFWNKLKEAIVA